MRRAFTAIELMVVVAVLMLLVGIAVPVVSGLRHKAKEKLAHSTLKAIGLALERYCAQPTCGVYPPGTDVDACTLYRHLVVPGFLEVERNDCRDEGDSKVILDPWGTPWVYLEFASRFKQRMAEDRYRQLMVTLKPHNPMSYDLYSLGPNLEKDEQHNGEDDDDDGMVDEEDELVDDITNW